MMNNKLPIKIIGFSLSYLLCLWLYWPSLQGLPIWDDYFFWLDDKVMSKDFPYIDYWMHFVWPMSLTAQKFFLHLYQDNLYLYHLTNLGLHFINSFLVYRLARKMRLIYPFLFFLLFLLNPVCVIAVAWIIQLKTQLCMFFALLTILLFEKGLKDYRIMLLATFVFYMSLASKAASLALPITLSLLYYPQLKNKRWPLVIPFFLLSGWSLYMIFTSSWAREGMVKAAVLKEITESAQKTPDPVPVAKESTAPRIPVEEKPLSGPIKKESAKKTPKLEPSNPPVPAPTSAPTPAPESLAQVPVPQAAAPTPPSSHQQYKFSKFDPGFIMKTLNYYFWQAILPFHNHPVKGLNDHSPDATDYIHLLFLVLIIGALWKSPILLYLLVAHLMLAPFLGFVIAPYMNITWVSDQHLYLVLPALLGFWFKLLGKIKWKFSWILPVIFIFFYAYKTHETTPYYKNQNAFYEASLAYNPENLPIIYNLAFSYITEGRTSEAYNLLKEIHDRSSENPALKQSFYWAPVTELYIMLLGYFSQKDKLEKN